MWIPRQASNNIFHFVFFTQYDTCPPKADTHDAIRYLSAEGGYARRRSDKAGRNTRKLPKVGVEPTPWGEPHGIWCWVSFAAFLKVKK